MPDDSPAEINQSELNPAKAHPPAPTVDGRFWIIVSAVALGSIFLRTCYFWLKNPLLMGSDQALLLAISQMMLDGKQLYTQIHEINPPLILYINLIPAVICRVFHVTAAHALAVLVLGWTLLSVSLAALCAHRHRDDDQSFYFLPLLMLFLFFIKSDIIDFGQKEQLLCISYLPFLLVRYFRWNDKKIGSVMAVICGVLAGIGICLKPYFLLIAATPELIFFLQKQKWKGKWKPLVAPEVVAAAAVGIIYIVHFFFLPKDVFDTFFYFILPLVKQGYAYFTVSPMRLLNVWRSDFLHLLLVVILAIPLRKYNRLLAPLVGFSLASVAAYLLAGQEWSYHLTPVRFGTYLLGGLEGATAVFILRSLLPKKRDRFDSILGYGIIVFFSGWLAVSLLGLYLHNAEKIPVTSSAGSISAQGSDIDAGMAQGVDWDRIVADYSKPGDSILFITSGVAPAYPLTLQTGRKCGSRYPHAMTLLMAKYIAWDKPGVVDKKPYERLLDRIIGEYGEDIKNNQPTLIVVEKSEVNAVLTKFDFYDKFMPNYYQAEKLEEYLIFTRKK